MLPRIVIGLLCALLLAPTAHGAEAVQDERVATYKEFRTAFDAADYAKALPLAVQVVQQTRSQFGAESLEMVNPRTNVATTYYRMGRFGEALDGYREVLTQLDQQDDATNPLLIRPLHGIGATLHAMNRDAEAIAPLKRAVDITRNREGMQSPSQLPLLKELVACYMSTGRIQEAGTEQSYAFNVAEATYGRNDIRMLGPIDDYARWNEAAGRYSAARALHLHAVQLADAVLGNMTVQSVNGLRGIARTYRLAFVNGEPEETAAAAADSFSGSMLAAPVMITPTLAAEGERALRIAIQRLAAAHPGAAAATGRSAGRPGRLVPDRWGRRRARCLFTARHGIHWRRQVARSCWPHPCPSPIARHPPPRRAGSRTRPCTTRKPWTCAFRSTPTARCVDAVVTNPVADRESSERAVAAALKRSVFRPVMADGATVSSTDQVFREQVYVKRPKIK